VEDQSDLQFWFARERSIKVTEEIIGLGAYGKTLTVLTVENPDDLIEESEDDDRYIESWRRDSRD
jgi:hypothetical protein